MDKAEQVHEKDLTEITSLQHALNETEDMLRNKVSDHEAVLDEWKSRVAEAEQARENNREAISSLQNALVEKENLLQSKLQQALIDQDEYHKNDVNTWKAKVIELERLNNDIQDKIQRAQNDQDTHCQADLDDWKSRVAEAAQVRENDRQTIVSLQSDLNEKENLWHNKLQQALSDQDILHQKVVELERLNREMSGFIEQPSAPEDHTECNKELSSLKIDLQNALNDREETNIKHNLELSSANAEFHNVCCSLDELQKENQKLKIDIDELNSMAESVKNRNFEKEMNSAHTRFESMERSLQDRISHLERGKDKLLADFNNQIVSKDEEHMQTKIELSAWKLEMQNALNDIEALKKERDELKAQVAAYATSLEAV